MIIDFTLSTYIKLLHAFIDNGYDLIPFRDFYLDDQNNKCICIRHDVDRIPFNSVVFARILNQKKLRGTFFFRSVISNKDKKSIVHIANLGHEIGYHYESLSTKKGNFQTAITDFKKNLELLRELVAINTICMHGSPLSRYDSRRLWKEYEYREYGIIAEPYFDIDFSEVLYLTDTGRRWNGDSVAVRDKLTSYISKNNNKKQYHEKDYKYFYDWKVKPPVNSSMNMTSAAINFQNKYNFKTTADIIRAAEYKELPDKIMLTFHPQRWTNQPIHWFKELLLQNTKNVVKYFFIKLGRK